MAGPDTAERRLAPVAAGEPTLSARVRGWLDPRRSSALYLWAVFVVVFGLLTPETYLTSTTIRVTFSQGVVTGILALAFLVPLVAGAFDLSIGAVMSLSLGISAYLGLNTSLSPWLCAAVALLCCATTGAISGFIVVKLRVNSFIATLGMSQALLAAVLLISDNRQITGAFPKWWLTFGGSMIGPIPTVVVILFALGLVIWYVLECTPAGRYLVATGANADAARLAGVKTDRMIWLSLVASAVIAGSAGVVFSMQTGVFSSSIGPGYLFPAVAAVFLGASQFSRRPNVWGTLIAYFALAFGIKGLQLLSGPGGFWVGPLFEAVSLIAAVAIASRPTSGVRSPRRKRGLEDESAGEAEKAETA